jgi:hypothetical protein
MIKERIYSEWNSMRSRCSKTYHGHKNYFDKGIAVCDEWKKDFEPFYKWSIENGYNDDLTIDRIDNNKNYSPDNCRWVTMKEQQNNRTNNVNIEYNGKVQTLKQWCEELGLNYGMVKARRQRGIKVPELFKPKHKNQYQ